MRAQLLPSLVAAVCLACGTVPPTKAPEVTHKPPPDDPRRVAPPDEGMSVEGLQGTLDDDDVQRVIADQMTGFEYCFQRGSGTYIAGKVMLEFQVARSGRVRSVYVSESDLGSLVIEDCLVKTASFLVFPPPTGGGPARFAFPFAWNERGRRLSTPVPIDWGYPTLRDARDAVDSCRQAHGFPGPFHITAYIGRKGRVLSSGFHAAKPAGDFPACVDQALKEMDFPNPGNRVYRFQALVEDLRS